MKRISLVRKRILAAVLSVCVAAGSVVGAAGSLTTVQAAQAEESMTAYGEESSPLQEGTESPEPSEIPTETDSEEGTGPSYDEENPDEDEKGPTDAAETDGEVNEPSDAPETEAKALDDAEEDGEKQPEETKETEAGTETAPADTETEKPENGKEDPAKDGEDAPADAENGTGSAEPDTEEKDTEEVEGSGRIGKIEDDEDKDIGDTEEEMQDRELPRGLLPAQTVPLSAKEIAENSIVASDEFLSAWQESRAAHTYSSEWDKYKSYYYYNQLDEDERDLWDALETVCLTFMTTQENASYMTSGGKRYYHLDSVSSFSLSLLEMYRIVRLFRISNPQYYFLNNIVLTGGNGFSNMIAMGVYTKFANGSTRMSETQKVKAQVTAWINEVSAYPDDEQKVRKIHDLIVDRVDYNYSAVESGNVNEDDEYTQTAYSAICLPLTVCAGYAQAFAMVCNGAGIDAVSVTSADHQWNKVRINDSWYNVDLTWDDSGAGKATSYQYFERNDKYYDSDYPQNAQSHREETDRVILQEDENSVPVSIPMWTGNLPVCSLDSNPAAPYTVPGSVPAITETTAKPQISVKRVDDEIEVTLKSATSGAVIYYSTDGKAVPSPASTKCLRYTDTFVLESGAKIQAVAVRDGKLDSAAVQTTVSVKKIKFNGNGSGSGSMSNVTYLAGSGQKLPANKFKRSYYTFSGWNTKKDGKGTSYSDKQAISAFPSGSGNTITLYAQWKKTNYKITYNLNGGKNNSKNPATYTHWTATIQFKNPTRTGYKFGGWYTDKKLTKKATQIKKGSSGNVTLYAKWTANKYTIAFNGNGSTSGKMSALTARKYGKSYKLTANKFKRTGYTFVGWNTKKNGKGKSYTDKQSVKNLTSKADGKVTLYAQWKKTKYKIVYNLNGGTNNSKNPSSYTYTTATIKLKNPTRKGYTFVGWYSDKKCTKKVTRIKKGTTGKITLYAKWKKK